MLKRILSFNKQDWKHIGWLIKGIGEGFLHGDIHQITECYYFVKFHLSYSSK